MDKGCVATSRSQGEKRFCSFPRDPLIAGQLINTLDCFFLFIQLVPLSKVQLYSERARPLALISDKTESEIQRMLGCVVTNSRAL